ncbi:MAG: adenylosuccinate lyase [Brumimicrobium sp.]|nr:adenylosuccinate lyase [Brumimicrobium sp.]
MSIKLNTLTAISPIDGRYRSKSEDLASYFSEFGLIRYRTLIEIEYLIALAENSGISNIKINPSQTQALREVYKNFTEEDALVIKGTEKVTNHDVKAVEYFVKDKMKSLGLESILEFVHFGLTSQDINNTAIPLLLKEAVNSVYLPELDKVCIQIKTLADEWKNIPMLARTHGQPATPTKLGKELFVFYERIQVQLKQLKQIPFSAKFGGATGNLNAHFVAYPQKDWVHFANDFVEKQLGLTRSQTTTQIEHYDNLAALFDAMKRINTILIDMNRDIWTYISIDYFKQKVKEGEVGSSAMPHKVNPIDFENSEGNLGLANALFEFFAQKLPISRLQRDLTDSTVLRNIGVPLAHSIIAFNSTQKGLEKLVLNESALADDLEDNWAVIAEAIQTILRREGYPQPYEALKKLTRKNEKVTKETVHHFIDNLEVNELLKKELKNITPHNYTGF